MVAVIQDFIGLATVVVEFLLRRELDLCIAFVVRDFGDSKSTFAECRKLGSESREELVVLGGTSQRSETLMFVIIPTRRKYHWCLSLTT